MLLPSNFGLLLSAAILTEETGRTVLQKLSHQLAGELGETLALAKLISVGLHAYASPPGAPGHDIMVVAQDGPKSVEVKTRQYIDKPSEITRWPVDMNTKGDADFFLFIELGLRTLESTFYLLDKDQAKATHRDHSGGGNCQPNRVRMTVDANDFSMLTGEYAEPMPIAQPQPVIAQPIPKRALNGLRHTIAQEADFGNMRIIQYSCQSIDVFVDGALQSNAIENLREVAQKVDVSEYNRAGGVRNTRQLGKAVIDAIKK